MLKQLTSPQLTELEVFWQLENGWGDFKQDYRFGQLCSLQANLNLNPKKRRRPYSPGDFAMRPKRQSWGDNTKKIRSGLDVLAQQRPPKKKKSR